eukprot:2583757-Rhodomonas_salina.2
MLLWNSSRICGMLFDPASARARHVTKGKKNADGARHAPLMPKGTPSPEAQGRKRRPGKKKERKKEKRKKKEKKKENKPQRQGESAYRGLGCRGCGR